MIVPSLAMAKCPNCGAPHAIAPNRHTLICIYCNTSLRIEHPAVRAPGVATEAIKLSAQAISKEDIERIKQLLLDGKREEGIALYARLAGISHADAEEAVNAVVLSAYLTLTSRLPINVFGFVLYGSFIAVGLAAIGYGAAMVGESLGYLALIALGLLFTVNRVITFGRHLKSTIVQTFGSLGRGRIVRSAMLRDMSKEDSYLIAVMYEVTPDDGRPTFLDQENLFVTGVTLKKMVPGAVVRVRFDSGRTCVFPVRPLDVLPPNA